ncbi:MAG TPA: hypothetical protein VK869_06415 [Rubrobacteraceae bacterium]|nr:hypothetical protein [Rubrobacteraceae bacterium]
MLTGRVLVVTAIFSTVFLLGVWGPEGWAQDGDAGGSGASESVTVELEGEEGASFSGVCSVGEERSEIGGEVPQSFEFDVDGRKLSCEIHKEDGRNAALEVAVNGNGSRSVQRIEGGEGTLRLTYEGGAVSTSMSSGSSDGAGDSSSSDDDAPPDGGEDLADQIQQMVDEILEQIMQ